MGTIAPRVLSGSTNGRQIKIGATSTPGTLIHTAVAGASDMDEIWLWAMNSDTEARKITIELGGTTAPDDLIEEYIPPESGQVWIVKAARLQNSLVIRAFASVTNVVMVGGYVNRITV